MDNEEVQEFGLQLGAKDDGIGSVELVLGEGGVEDIMEGYGSIISTYSYI
jgi:hypothetical protein